MLSGDALENLARRLARDEVPAGVELVKRSRVRIAARSGDVFLKVFLKKSRTVRREARALERARALELPVPELIAAGERWIATRFLANARPATRADLDLLLPAIERMHERRMLHRDLHLGNCMIVDGRPMLLDLQRAVFLPVLPRRLRERELGFFAYSLGEPLPAELEHVRAQTRRRAQAHWRSRTKRCLVESTGFTRFDVDGKPGFQRREADAAELRAALSLGTDGEVIKLGRAGNLYRCNDFILKQHRHEREAREAWVSGHGLEVRGIPTGGTLAWSGRWLVMRDEGDTLIDWLKSSFEKAEQKERQEMADRVTDLLADLHRRGIYHADLKANNVLWSPGRLPRLVDYGRVRFGRDVPFSRRVKNLAQLNAALPDYVPAALREASLSRYVAGSGFTGDVARLRRDVIAESLKRHHRWSGC